MRMLETMAMNKRINTTLPEKSVQLLDRVTQMGAEVDLQFAEDSDHALY